MIKYEGEECGVGTDCGPGIVLSTEDTVISAEDTVPTFSHFQLSGETDV